MKRVTLLIIPMILALGLVVAGWRAWDQTSAPPILLSDGSWLEFRAVTVGTNGTYHYGAPWHRLLVRIPGKFGRKHSGQFIVNAGLGSPTNVIFWLVRRGAPKQTNIVTTSTMNQLGQIIQTGQVFKRGAPTTVVRVMPFDGLRVNVRDDQGQGEPGYDKFKEVSLPNGEVAMYWSVEAVPCHSPTLKLCVYWFRQGGGGQQRGEMFIPNPLYRKDP